MKTSEHVEQFLRFLDDCGEQFRIAEVELEQVSAETQDLLHRLELYDDRYHETAALAKKLREVRRRRRVAKDTKTRLEPVVVWYDSHKKEIGAMQRLLGEIRKIESRQSVRAYVPKTKILEEPNQ